MGIPATEVYYSSALEVGLPVKILKAFLPSSILPTWPAHSNLLDLIALYIFKSRLFSFE